MSQYLRSSPIHSWQGCNKEHDKPSTFWLNISHKIISDLVTSLLRNHCLWVHCGQLLCCQCRMSLSPTAFTNLMTMPKKLASHFHQNPHILEFGFFFKRGVFFSGRLSGGRPDMQKTGAVNYSKLPAGPTHSELKLRTRVCEPQPLYQNL